MSLLADPIADKNLKSSLVLEETIAKSRDTFATTPGPPRSYAGISRNVCIQCTKNVTMDIGLKVRHGSSLHLRNITWKGFEEPIACVVMERLVLKSLRSDNRRILEAACERSGAIIEADEKFLKMGTSRNRKEQL